MPAFTFGMNGGVDLLFNKRARVGEMLQRCGCPLRTGYARQAGQ